MYSNSKCCKYNFGSIKLTVEIESKISSQKYLRKIFSIKMKKKGVGGCTRDKQDVSSYKFRLLMTKRFSDLKN